MARYRKDHSAEEQELEALLKAQEEPEKSEEELLEAEKPETPEEKTFKQRYSDLRRHSQKKEDEYKDRISALERQIDETKDRIPMPDISSPEEAAAWVEEYPDLAKIFRYLALEQDQKVKDEVKKTSDELEELKKKEVKQKAYQALIEAHPDAPKIIPTEEFQEWLSMKSEWMQDVFTQGVDGHKAADILDLYKATLVKTEKEKADVEKEKEDKRKKAAESVTRPTSPNAPSDNENETKYSESVVSRMSPREFEQHEDAIMAAIRAGKFEYDLSGAAR